EPRRSRRPRGRGDEAAVPRLDNRARTRPAWAAARLASTAPTGAPGSAREERPLAGGRERHVLAIEHPRTPSVLMPGGEPIEVLVERRDPQTDAVVLIAAGLEVERAQIRRDPRAELGAEERRRNRTLVDAAREPRRDERVTHARVA